MQRRAAVQNVERHMCLERRVTQCRRCVVFAFVMIFSPHAPIHVGVFVANAPHLEADRASRNNIAEVPGIGAVAVVCRLEICNGTTITIVNANKFDDAFINIMPLRIERNGRVVGSAFAADGNAEVGILACVDKIGAVRRDSHQGIFNRKIGRGVIRRRSGTFRIKIARNGQLRGCGVCSR